MKKKIFFTLITFIFSFSLQAQTGIVRGNLIDNDFQDPVPFANIIVKETGTGTTSDFDGNYELVLSEGVYTIIFSFIGYETVEVQDVVINSEEPTIVNVTMNTLAQGLDEVVVSVSASINTEKSVLEFQKKSISLVDGLSSQRIKSSGAEVDTLGDLVSFNKSDLMKFRNFGKKSLTELEELVIVKGLNFGMDLSKYKLDKE